MEIVQGSKTFIWLPLKLLIVHGSSSSKWASPPNTGKKAWASVPPDPSNGSPSPCSPSSNLTSIWTLPDFFWTKLRSVCFDQTFKAFLISPSTSRLDKRDVEGYRLILYVKSLTRHLLPGINMDVVKSRVKTHVSNKVLYHKHKEIEINNI